MQTILSGMFREKKNNILKLPVERLCLKRFGHRTGKISDIMGNQSYGELQL